MTKAPTTKTDRAKTDPGKPVQAKTPPSKASTKKAKTEKSAEKPKVRKTPASSGKAKRLAPKAEDESPATVVAAELVEESERFDPEAYRVEAEAEGVAADLEDAELIADLDQAVVRPALPGAVDESARAASTAGKSLATADPVATYLAEIRRYALLTKEQERELAIRYHETGDPKAAELLVTSNLRFVVKIAAEYSKFGAKLIDLIQEGNVGLMHAVKEFNPYKGVRLITYAVWWIRGYIQEYLMRQYSMVRIGTTQNQRKLFYRLQKERELLGQAGQEPNYALLAGRLGVSEEEVEMMSKRLTGRDISLNTPIDGESTVTRLDFEASPEPAVDEELGRRELIDLLNENLEKIRPKLSEKETYILENRLLADEPVTLQEIGEHYGVTREAVRQLEARLIGKIREAVTESLGDGPDSDDEE
jgi:RNA polymerase sigma-32 factor